MLLLLLLLLLLTTTTTTTQHPFTPSFPRTTTLTGDGASLTTFFRKAKRREPTLLVLRATGGEVFGGFASKAWHDKGEVSKGS